jgi:hypothetical protein
MHHVLRGVDVMQRKALAGLWGAFLGVGLVFFIVYY